MDEQKIEKIREIEALEKQEIEKLEIENKNKLNLIKSKLEEKI